MITRSNAKVPVKPTVPFVGVSLGEGNVRKVRLNTASASDEINGLAKLQREDVITAEEFEIGKNNILNGGRDKIDEKAKNLKMLHSLKKQGILTDGEFNMKNGIFYQENKDPGALTGVIEIESNGRSRGRRGTPN